MIYAVIALGIITLCIVTIVYVQHTVIRVLREEIDKINEANDYNFPETWNAIDETNIEWKKGIRNLKQSTYDKVDSLENRIRKEFDTERTQRKMY